MKTNYLFLLLICFFSLQLSAQEDEVDMEEIEEKAKMMIDSILNEKAEKRVSFDFGTMGLGFPTFLSEGSFDLPQMYDYLDLNFWRSGHWYIDAADVSIGLMPTGKPQKLRLAAGVRYSLHDYSFSNQFQLLEGQASFAERVDPASEIRKHRIHAHYIQIPVMLEFNTNRSNPSESINFAIGYNVNFRFASNYKVKFEDRDLDKIKFKDDFNLADNFGMLEVRAGFGQFNIYVQYGLDRLFTEGNGPNVTPINIGITSQ